MSNKKGFTFWGADWFNSAAINTLSTHQQLTYLNLMFLYMLEGGSITYDLKLFSNKFNARLRSVEASIETLESQGYVIIKNNILTMPAADKRLTAMSNGSKGAKVREANKAATELKKVSGNVVDQTDKKSAKNSAKVATEQNADLFDTQFNLFWNNYKRENDKNKGNKQTSKKRFKALKPAQRLKALEVLPTYLKYCLDNDQFIKTAEVYLSKRTFNDDYFSVKAEVKNTKLLKQRGHYYNELWAYLVNPNRTDPNDENKGFTDYKDFKIGADFVAKATAKGLDVNFTDDHKKRIIKTNLEFSKYVRK